MNINDSLIIGIICGFLVAASIILILILFSRIILNLRDRKRQKYLDFIQTFLTEYLLSTEVKTERSVQKIKRLTRTRYTKSLLIDQLIDLNDHFSGIYNEKVYDLYDLLELSKHSLRLFNSNLWHIKIRGIYELSTLNHEESYEKILQYINHRDEDIRRNARVAIVKLRKKEALMQLKDMEGKMSQWTIINILNILKRSPIKLTTEELEALKKARNISFKELVPEIEKTSYAY